MMNNELVLIILLMVLNKNRDKKSLELPDSRNIFDKNIDLPYTMEKIKIMKKIGPYFPEDFHPMLNKSIIIAEKIVKTYEVIEFMQEQETNYIQEVIPVKNNRERLSYISNIIQKELHKGNIKDIGVAMETILNIERYKKIFTALIPIMSDPDTINSPDKIFDLMEVFMDGKTEKEKAKMKEMVKMLEVMKTLNTPKKESSS